MLHWCCVDGDTTKATEAEFVALLNAVLNGAELLA